MRSGGFIIGSCLVSCPNTGTVIHHFLHILHWRNIHLLHTWKLNLFIMILLHLQLLPVVQKIKHPSSIDLKETDLKLWLQVSILSLSQFKYIWSPLLDSLHGKGLSRSCLTICKACDNTSVEQIINGWHYHWLIDCLCLLILMECLYNQINLRSELTLSNLKSLFETYLVIPSILSLHSLVRMIGLATLTQSISPDSSSLVKMGRFLTATQIFIWSDFLWGLAESTSRRLFSNNYSNFASMCSFPALFYAFFWFWLLIFYWTLTPRLLGWF